MQVEGLLYVAQPDAEGVGQRLAIPTGAGKAFGSGMFPGRNREAK